MTTHSDASEQQKTFNGSSASAARDAASSWLRNFSLHGPLDIRSIRVTEEGESFVATVVYSDASIDFTPRHFPEPKPVSPPMPHATPLDFVWPEKAA